MMRHHFSKVLFAGLALAVCSGTLHAAVAFSAGATPPTSITCDTVLGLSDPTVVNLVLATSSIPSQTALASVTAGTSGVPGNPAAIQIVTTAATTVGSTTVSVPFSFKMKPGCQNAVDGSTVNFVFTGSVGLAAGAFTLPITMHVTNVTASALQLSPSSLTVSCTRGGNPAVDTPVAGAQTVNITSAANGGTPFTIDTAHAPAWLTLGGAAIAANQTAGPVGDPLTLIGNSTNGCNGALPGTYSGSVSLLNPPAPPKVLTVYLQVGLAPAVQASGTPLFVRHTIGSTGDFVSGEATTNITKSGGNEVYWNLDPTTVPTWLSPSVTSGTTPTNSITIKATSAADAMAPGIYTANIHFKVSGALDFVLPVTLQLSQASASLTTADGGSQTISWTQGSALPTFVITPIATGSTIQYTVAPGVVAGDGSTKLNSGQVDSITSGIAIPGLASPFYVNFPQSTFSAAVPNVDLKGSVVLTYPTSQTTTVNLTVHVLPAAAQTPMLTGSVPTALSTAPAGTVVTVTLTGSGFSDGSVYPATIFGVLNGANVQKDNNIAANISAGSIVVTITVPVSADPYLPFSGAGGPITFAACNPTAGNLTCTAAQTTYQVQVGGNPVIQAVTSASSFVQPPVNMLAPVAPYDIISIFGTNFCVSGNTGCKTSAMYGQLDPVTLKYATTLATPGDPTATQRYLTVNFQTHGGTVTQLGAAPILYASNNQVNVIVPDKIFTKIGSTVDIVVTFGYGNTPTTLLTSAPFSVLAVAADPGVFVMTGDGQGDAAAENANNSYKLVNSSNPAASTDNTGDTIQLFVTGLGKPDSTGAAASANTWGYSCLDPNAYYTLVSPSLTSDDGLILQSALINPSYAPCFKASGSLAPRTPIAVTIGGAPATVGYAGWVDDSVAGLYQVNVTVPKTSDFAALSSPVTVTGAGGEMPIVVTLGTPNALSSQPGATLFVARRADMAVTPAVSSGVMPTQTIPADNSTTTVISAAATSSACTTFSYAFPTPSVMPTGWTTSTSLGTITIDDTASPVTNQPITITATCTAGDTGITGTASFTVTLTH